MGIQFNARRGDTQGRSPPRNLVENAIRPTAIGKKNRLFFGSAKAGQRSTVRYTLIANCRLHGVEPSACLTDVLERLPGRPISTGQN